MVNLHRMIPKEKCPPCGTSRLMEVTCVSHQDLHRSASRSAEPLMSRIQTVHLVVRIRDAGSWEQKLEVTASLLEA